MESGFLFNLFFGFMFTCFSPTQFGLEGIFLPDLPTMNDVMTTAMVPKEAPDNNDNKKKTETIFAAIPNGTRDEIAKWCETRAGSDAEMPTIAPDNKQRLRDRSPFGKFRMKGGDRRPNMNLG
jgi:hypothetical protein